VSRAGLALAAVAAFLLIAVAFLFNNDAGLRWLVEYQVAARTGRTLDIAGDFGVDWSLHPRVHAERVKLDNAPWGSRPIMLEVERVVFTISLLDLLRGDFVLPQVDLSRPWVLLEFSADGQRNWILESKAKRRDDALQIKRLTLDAGTLVYRNPSAETDLTLAIVTDPSAHEARQTNVKAKGVFRGMNASAEGSGGPVLNLRDKTVPYPLDVKAQIGNTRASAEGVVGGLVALAEADLAVSLQGANLRQLGPILEITLPATSKYSVAGRLIRNGPVWEFNQFEGSLGKSDLSGSIGFTRAGERPNIRADLHSHQLVLDELKRKEESKDPLRFDRLRAFDADVKLAARTVKRKDRSVGGLTAHLQLNNGELKLDPLNFAAASGMVNSHVTLNAHDDPPSGHAQVQVSRMQLGAIFLKSKPKGMLAGSAKLTGAGQSLEAMIGSSDGDVQFVISEGEISPLLVSFVGLNATGLFRSLIGERERIPVNCAVGHFKLEDGVMHTKALVIDTTKNDIAGSGTIDLGKKTYDLTFAPLEEKKGLLSKLLYSGAPVHVGGTFKNPQFSTDTGSIAARGGAAVALGIINPLAALIPLLAPASEKEANNCVALMRNLKAGS
jgi:uncharacterized protein involved in outer membrane biogenesis